MSFNLTDDNLLLVSTRKGLFALQSEDRVAWTLSEPEFLGHIINHAVLDPRDQKTITPCSTRETRKPSLRQRSPVILGQPYLFPLTEAAPGGKLPVHRPS
jgi:hypothetical protein